MEILLIVEDFLMLDIPLQNYFLKTETFSDFLSFYFFTVEGNVAYIILKSPFTLAILFTAVSIFI